MAAPTPGGSDDDLAFAPALDLAARIHRRELSPVELLELFLARVERIDPALNSVVTLDAEAALRAARAAERTAGQEGTGAFHGVPLLVKDLHLTAGMRTTFATKSLADFVPEVDDEHVARLRRAGFVLFGKTNAPELGSLPYTESALLGPCRNPWDTARTPGGSSGGAAAALAAGLNPVGHASDGAGSARIPASNCGLFGLKPARGRISNAPLFGDIAGGLSSPAVLSRFPADAAAMLDAMRGYAPGDPHWAPDPQRPYREIIDEEPGPLRVGVVTTSPLTTFDGDALAAVDTAVALLEDLGHRLEPLVLPAVDERFREEFLVLWSAALAASPVDRATMEPFNAALAARGEAFSAARLLQATAALQLFSRLIVGAMGTVDVVLCPTLTRAPLRIGELAGLHDDAEAVLDALTAYIGYTPVANVTGQPAINLPLHWNGDGLPIGVMVTGRPADEATLLRLAAQVERAAGWSARRPPVS